MTIQKRLSFFELYIAIVVDVRILTIFIKRIEIAIVVVVAIVVAIIILESIKIVVDFANNIDKLSNILIAIALSTLDLVHFDIIHNLFNFKRIDENDIVNKYVRVDKIVKFNASVKQETRSTIEKSDRK